MQVVCDPNVLVSALATPGGVCAELLAELAAAPVQIVTSPRLIAELCRVLDRPRFAHLPQDDIRTFCVHLARVSAVDDDPPAREGDPGSIDPKDDYLIHLTLATPGRLLVTGDRHLLDLAGSVPVVTPRVLLDGLRGCENRL